MRIGIIGAGSIGSLVAGCLASTDSTLLLYGRGLHAAELMVNGLTLSGVKDDQINGDRWEVIPSEHPLPLQCTPLVMLLFLLENLPLTWSFLKSVGIF